MTDSHWWQHFYNGLHADVLLERDERATAATVEFLRATLELSPGSRVFDQCCGIGSLSVPLARRGLQVVGVDQSCLYIDRARAAAAEAQVEIDFHAEDASHFVPETLCDGAFNWWTSFGYSPEDDENAKMLQRAFESLRPGGRFALDTPNLPGVFRSFKWDAVTRRQTSNGEVILIRESEVDLAAGMLRKRWTYLLPDGNRTVYPSQIRLYLPHTLIAMLETAGFIEVELFGSVAGDTLTLDSPRCIALARRPPE